MSGRFPRTLDRALVGFFLIFVFGSTWSISVSQIAMIAAAVLWLARVLVTREHPFRAEHRAIWTFMGLYAGFMFLACLAGETPVRSLRILVEEWLFIVIPVTMTVTADPQRQDRAVTVLAAGVLLFSLYAIGQYFTGWQLLKPGAPPLDVAGGERIRGNFSHQLTFANYYGTAALLLSGMIVERPRAWSRKLRGLATAAAGCGVVAMILTLSRGPVLALVGALVVLALMQGRRWRLRSAGVVALLALVVVAWPALRVRFGEGLARELSLEHPGGRFFIWNITLDIIAEHPWLGVGQGNYLPEYARRLGPDAPDWIKMPHAHNDLLNVTALAGFPGGLSFLGMWVAVLVYFRRRLKQADAGSRQRAVLLGALLGSVFFFLASFTEAAFADEEVRQLLMFVWGLGMAAGVRVSDRKVNA